MERVTHPVVQIPGIVVEAHGATGATENVGDVLESTPPPTADRHQMGCRSTADRHRDELPCLDAANDLTRVLTQFAEPDVTHSVSVAQLLPRLMRRPWRSAQSQRQRPTYP